MHKAPDSTTFSRSVSEASERNHLIATLLAADHHLLLCELPQIAELISMMVRTQGYLYPDLWRVREVFGRFKEGMEGHMRREEEFLRMLYSQERPATHPPRMFYGTSSDMLQSLEQEHRLAEEALAEISELTQGYRPPADAGARYKVLMQDMADLDKHVRQHIAAQRSIFAPQAIVNASPKRGLGNIGEPRQKDEYTAR